VQLFSYYWNYIVFQCLTNHILNLTLFFISMFVLVMVTKIKFTVVPQCTAKQFFQLFIRHMVSNKYIALCIRHWLIQGLLSMTITVLIL
jgi:hypothetical protein